MNEVQAIYDLHLLLSPPQQLPVHTQYTSLNTARQEIRLLRIWKPDPDSCLHARLETVSLVDPPAYEALSYCWGAPGVQKVMVVNKEEVLLRDSLYSFLNILATTGQPLPIWLDVLCINQNDMTERSQQVSLMSQIYRGAKRVLSWIGEPNMDSEYAFAFAQYHRHPKLLQSNHYSLARSRARESWLQILGRPYWRRVWIVQEICLGNCLLLLCGLRAIEWSDFMGVLRDLLELSEHQCGSKLNFDDKSLATYNTADRFSIANIFHLETARSVQQRDFEGASTKSLAEIVIDFKGFQCSEQKDHVYGFASLAAQPFPIDYSKSFADIFFDLVKHSKFSATQNATRRLPDCQTSAWLAEPLGFAALRDLGSQLVSAFSLPDTSTQLIRSLDSTEYTYLRARLVDFHHFYRKVRRPESSCSILWRYWPIQPGCFPQRGDLLFMVEESFWRNPVLVVRKEEHKIRCIGLVNLWSAHEAIKDVKVFKYAMHHNEVQLCDALTFDSDAEECNLFLHFSRIFTLSVFVNQAKLEHNVEGHRERYPVQPLCPRNVSADQRHENSMAFDRSVARYRPEWKRVEHHQSADGDTDLKRIRAECFPGAPIEDSLWSYSYEL